jgi:hypothetical protein
MWSQSTPGLHKEQNPCGMKPSEEKDFNAVPRRRRTAADLDEPNLFAPPESGADPFSWSIDDSGVLPPEPPL